MAKEKENKTNAMRILDKNKINYEVNTYECDEFLDGVHIADMLGQPYESTFKTLVTEGKTKNYYVFAIPIALELDMKKAAKAVGEKSIEMVHVKDINAVTGYIRGGCTPIGMKKQYKTVYHDTIKDFDKVIVSGGKLGTQIIIAPDDLIKVTRAEVCDIVKDLYQKSTAEYCFTVLFYIRRKALLRPQKRSSLPYRLSAPQEQHSGFSLSLPLRSIRQQCRMLFR